MAFCELRGQGKLLKHYKAIGKIFLSNSTHRERAKHWGKTSQASVWRSESRSSPINHPRRLKKWNKLTTALFFDTLQKVIQLQCSSSRRSKSNQFPSFDLFSVVWKVMSKRLNPKIIIYEREQLSGLSKVEPSTK